MSVSRSELPDGMNRTTSDTVASDNARRHGVPGRRPTATLPERPVFGTVRYKSYESTCKTFDSAAYISWVDKIERGG
jgi:hypothetical protein